MQLQEADLTTQAQRAAMNIQTAAQSTWQAGSKGASDAFSRFVEGDDAKNLAYGEDSYKGDPDKKEFWDSFAAAGESRVEQRQQQKKKQEPERKDFWDEFASIGESRANAQQGGGIFGASGAGTAKTRSSIGTAAMKKGPSGPAAKGGGDDTWEEW
jgi:ADP-ribosylation factor GTPase-activating protein 1